MRHLSILLSCLKIFRTQCITGQMKYMRHLSILLSCLKIFLMRYNSYLVRGKSLIKSEPLNIKRNKVSNKKINNILLPFICMYTCNLFPFYCSQRLQLSRKAIIGQEMVWSQNSTFQDVLFYVS